MYFTGSPFWWLNEGHGRLEWSTDCVSNYGMMILVFYIAKGLENLEIEDWAKIRIDLIGCSVIP